MTYQTALALRTALEQRLVNQARSTGIAIDRLRRQVVVQRILARLDAAEPGRWVLKGGMALEVRLHDGARVTKDLDLGLRDEPITRDDLHDRLVRALSVDLHNDRFELAPSPPEELTIDGGGRRSWRVRVAASLAGKPFGRLKLDVFPRPHELTETDRIELPNALAFAGVPPTVAEVVDVHRHAAEKLHAMLRTFGERENSRVRDLYDLTLLIDHDLLDPGRTAAAAERVWQDREGRSPPPHLPPFPESWPGRLDALARSEDADISFSRAQAAVRRLWDRSIATEES